MRFINKFLIFFQNLSKFAHKHLRQLWKQKKQQETVRES